ncbi:MAG: ATP-grasp domain-containing protein [Candidatus Sericytochromatia bacterium]
MVRILALSPYFPENFGPFWLRLREAGAQVLGVGDAPYESLSQPLREALSEYWRVDDLHDRPALLHACREMISRHGALTHLESHNEYWLETEAWLRSELKLPGPNLDTITPLKRKSQMQHIYTQAGIPVAPGALVTSLNSCRQLAQEAGYPLVAKPDIGVGAALTYKLHSDAELEAFWQHKPEVDYFLQGFVGGQLISFDGLADREGRIVLAASHVFRQGIMETVNDDLDLAYWSLRDIPAELQSLGERAVAAFDVRERFFHFEFFHRPDGSWVALEVNMRPPGGWTTDMINYTNDIDLYKGYADLLMTGQVPFVAQRPWHCGYAGRKERPYRHSHEDILEQLGDAVVHHGAMAEVFHPVMGRYGYLVRDASLERVQEMIALIQAL